MILGIGDGTWYWNLVVLIILGLTIWVLSGGLATLTPTA